MSSEWGPEGSEMCIVHGGMWADIRQQPQAVGPASRYRHAAIHCSPPLSINFLMNCPINCDYLIAMLSKMSSTPSPAKHQALVIHSQIQEDLVNNDCSEGSQGQRGATLLKRHVHQYTQHGQKEDPNKEEGDRKMSEGVMNKARDKDKDETKEQGAWGSQC
ncbi:hypothetical protein IW262DRAFT_1297176 [Armillaria fumosa]|nr:hypothetical protein IW262DRAFT_1297176 [Armillaria fumosa]